MKICGFKYTVFCVSMVLLVACQFNKPEDARRGTISSPESTLSSSGFNQDKLVEIYEQAQPGVVSIRAITDGRALLGSGFVLDEEGHILTNSHVVSEGESIEVLFPSGNLLAGIIIGMDKATDLAVLEVENQSEDLRPLVFGDSNQVKVGQFVTAIGNPIGLQNTMTSGIVSGLGSATRKYGKINEMQAFADASTIQTDAAINQGNSGGPLIDLNVNVIGINSARLTSGFESSVSGIGFATASNVLKVIVPQLIEKGGFSYPYLGINSTGDLTLAERKALGLDRLKGVYVAEVIEGSPADVGGLISGTGISPIPGVKSGGDLIVKVDGKEVVDFSQLMMYIVLNKTPGEEIVLNVLRGDENIDLVINLGERQG